MSAGEHRLSQYSKRTYGGISLTMFKLPFRVVYVYSGQQGITNGAFNERAAWE